LRRTPRMHDRAPTLIAECTARIAQATAYAHEQLEDMPEIRDWVWSDT
jgi:xylulose-5-phosphate/fructose-6-phosphate phosphoketolase